VGVNIWFPSNNLSLLRPIDTKLGVWVAYVKRQHWIASQISVIKVKVTVAKIENQFSLNNMSLRRPIDARLGLWVYYTKRQFRIATYVSVIKVNVTVAK